MIHKTNGTNEKVFPQGFISAQKKKIILDPLKIRENHIFGGVFIDFINMCSIFFG